MCDKTQNITCMKEYNAAASFNLCFLRGVRCLDLFERTEKYVIIKPFRLLFQQCSVAIFFFFTFLYTISLSHLPHTHTYVNASPSILPFCITKCALLFVILTFYCLVVLPYLFCLWPVMCLLEKVRENCTSHPDEISWKLKRNKPIFSSLHIPTHTHLHLYYFSELPV